MCIVDLIRVDNNNEHQLEDPLSRNQHKWIWDLGTITLYDLDQGDGFYSKAKGVEMLCPFPDFAIVDHHIFIYIVTFLLSNYTLFYGVDYIWLLMAI